MTQHNMFEAMGKTIPHYRREAGYLHARELGLSNEVSRFAVDGMCVFLEKDDLYGATNAGLVYLYPRRIYGLVTVLLTAEESDD